MKKVKRRATFAMLIAAAIVVGLVIYVIRLADNGRDWAMFRANATVYSGGVIGSGTVYDRNGIVLAHSGDGVYYYADSQATRIACVHTVGDYQGNIGTGALTIFSAKLVNYSFVNGTYSNSDTGGEVELSIDSDLCTVAYNALNGRDGAVLVSNYKTGEIICLVSTPGFDPNDVTSDVDGAYLNSALRSTFTPGSVYKIVTLAAAIENISDLYTRSFYCGGSVKVGSDTVNCTGTHGSQTIEQAFANSCNCAFSELALELGGDTLSEYAKQLGITDELKLDGISILTGSFDISAAGTSLLAWSGIGQSTNLCSPYAFMRLCSAIANGGLINEPTLLLGNSNSKTRVLAQDTADKIASMMSYNVAYRYGASNFPGLNICAKTGTAETSGASHSWFTGFLDDDEYPYAFAVIIEHGGSGLSNAGGVANAVLQAAVSK